MGGRGPAPPAEAKEARLRLASRKRHGFQVTGARKFLLSSSEAVALFFLADKEDLEALEFDQALCA